MKIKRFEFNMFPENCYVLWDETNEAVVIDPGCFYEEEKQTLKNFIIKNGLNVKHLLNTHLHLDHIFGNPFMLKEFGLKAEANQADEFWIDEAPKQSRMFGFQLQEAPCPGHLSARWRHHHLRQYRTGSHPCAGTLARQPGVLLRGRPLHVLGGCAVSRQHRPCDLTGGNFDELIEHICSRLFILPNDTIVYPGHGAPTTIGIEKAENPFFR